MKKTYGILIVFILLNFLLYVKPSIDEIRLYKNEIIEIKDQMSFRGDEIKKRELIAMSDVEFIEEIDYIVRNSNLKSLNKEYEKNNSDNIQMIKYEAQGSKKDINKFLKNAIKLEDLMFNELQIELDNDIMIMRFVVIGSTL